MANITVTDCSVFMAPKDKFIGYSNITLNDEFVIKGLRIMKGREGKPFVAMPSERGRDNQYYDVCFPITKELRQQINDAVMDEAKALKKAGKTSTPAKSRASGKPGAAPEPSHEPSVDDIDWG